jgi:hypothetical protein
VVDLNDVDSMTAEKYSVKAGCKVLKHDFVLVNDQEAEDLREQKSRDALKALGLQVKFLNGLPVPDVD